MGILVAALDTEDVHTFAFDEQTILSLLTSKPNRKVHGVMLKAPFNCMFIDFDSSILIEHLTLSDNRELSDGNYKAMIIFASDDGIEVFAILNEVYNVFVKTIDFMHEGTWKTDEMKNQLSKLNYEINEENDTSNVEVLEQKKQLRELLIEHLNSTKKMVKARYDLLKMVIEVVPYCRVQEGGDIDNLGHLALACLAYINSDNVEKTLVSPKYTKKRRKQGKPAPKPYYECKVQKPKNTYTITKVHHEGESHFQYQHDVRGHFKRFTKGKMLKAGQTERIIWCPPFIRGPKDKPYIPKIYKV